MSTSKILIESGFSRAASPTVVGVKRIPQQLAAATAQLAQALGREKALLRERADLFSTPGSDGPGI
jgi:hypothetical protein